MNCSQHDYIEIACLYHYTLKVCTKKGTEHHGIAINTVYNEKNSSVYVLKMLSKNNSLNSIHLLKWMF
ncbi:Rho-binding antiterminator [Pseudoalteromonas ruthenica]|nr:hypothetical protein CWC19_17795 [Pseudoalteromonas aurantia]TMO66208.1 hypothetical protein CWC18_03710 [Pseudoalteromonas aurantia]TMO79008.1 hypothetical protein CWC20_00450 [Pseudoalteromonas aurantia]